MAVLYSQNGCLIREARKGAIALPDLRISSSSTDANSPLSLVNNCFTGQNGYQLGIFDGINVIGNLITIAIRAKFSNRSQSHFLSSWYSGNNINSFIDVNIYGYQSYTQVVVSLRNTSGGMTEIGSYNLNVPYDTEFHTWKFDIEHSSSDYIVTVSCDNVTSSKTISDSSYQFTNSWIMGIGSSYSSMNQKAFYGSIDLSNWYVENDGKIIWGNKS